jgi:hypothetical protein
MWAVRVNLWRYRRMHNRFRSLDRARRTCSGWQPGLKSCGIRTVAMQSTGVLYRRSGNFGRGRSRRQGWESCGLQVPVWSIACIGVVLTIVMECPDPESNGAAGRNLRVVCSGVNPNNAHPSVSGAGCFGCLNLYFRGLGLTLHSRNRNVEQDREHCENQGRTLNYNLHREVF